MYIHKVHNVVRLTYVYIDKAVTTIKTINMSITVFLHASPCRQATMILIVVISLHFLELYIRSGGGGGRGRQQHMLFLVWLLLLKASVVV